MSIPKEPRQQMINLMYLVLTALLALNVSAEVLNAFKLVSDGMETSNGAMQKKNNSLMAAFRAQDANDHEKTDKYLIDATEAMKIADLFVEDVKALKKLVIMESGGYKEGTNETVIKEARNYSSPTRVLIDKKEGDKLKKEIEVLREKLLALPTLTEGDKEQLKAQFTLSTWYDKDAAKLLGKKSWEDYLFDHVPVIAVNTILTKFQGDAKNSAGLVVEILLDKIGAADYKFDALNAKVIAASSYVLQGEEYTADIFVSATSSTQDPIIYIGDFDPAKLDKNKALPVKVLDNPLKQGFTQLDVEGGIGRYVDPARSVGVKEKTGVIKVKQPQGEGYDWFPFKLKYQVAPPGVVISPTKMNVFYIGVDNPVSISVSGFPADKVRPSITQGTIVGRNGDYVVKVKKPGEAKVNVSVGLDGGGSKGMGGMDFRVKRVPDPVAKVGTSKGGSLKSSTFKVQRGVIADLENFDFDVRFKIVGYEMTFAAARQDLLSTSTDGPLFSQKMLDYMKRAKPGDVFYFDKIKAKGPDGTTRNLPGIVFKLI